MTSEVTGAGPSVVVTSRSFGSGDADPAGLLRKVGLRVARADPAHDHPAFEKTLSEAVAWIAGTSPIDDRHLAAAPNLKIVARYGTGYDSVDLAAAARRGVAVTNTPGANAQAVADHTVGLMLAALRHLVAGNRASREGARPPLRGRELGALTVGVVGFGSIGRAVARRLTGGFGSRVLIYDPFVAPQRAREAGIELVDEQAVASALAQGRLAAAAVDVLASEPATSSPLLDVPNAIITPHVAAQTTQAIDRMGMMAAEEVVRVLAGGGPRHPLGVPPQGGFYVG